MLVGAGRAVGSRAAPRQAARRLGTLNLDILAVQAVGARASFRSSCTPIGSCIGNGSIGSTSSTTTTTTSTSFRGCGAAEEGGDKSVNGSSSLRWSTLGSRAVGGRGPRYIAATEWSRSDAGQVSVRSFSSSASAAVAAADEGAEAPSDECSVRILPSGVKQLKKLLEKEPDRFLRLTVNSGGCSGYQYEFKMDKECLEGDLTFEQDGVKVVIDGLSLEFLGACELDYTSEMIRASFQVVKNSNAEAGCGCGSSFSVGAGF